MTRSRVIFDEIQGLFNFMPQEGGLSREGGRGGLFQIINFRENALFQNRTRNGLCMTVRRLTNATSFIP